MSSLEAVPTFDISFNIKGREFFVQKFVLSKNAQIAKEIKSIFPKAWANYCESKGTFSNEINESWKDASLFCMKIQTSLGEKEVHFSLISENYSNDAIATAFYLL